MDDLKAMAASKGITITPKGYRLNGVLYHVESWQSVLNRVPGYNALHNQIIGWLRAA